MTQGLLYTGVALGALMMLGMCSGPSQSPKAVAAKPEAPSLLEFALRDTGDDAKPSPAAIVIQRDGREIDRVLTTLTPRPVIHTLRGRKGDTIAILTGEDGAKPRIAFRDSQGLEVPEPEKASPLEAEFRAPYAISFSAISNKPFGAVALTGKGHVLVSPLTGDTREIQEHQHLLTLSDKRQIVLVPLPGGYAFGQTPLLAINAVNGSATVTVEEIAPETTAVTTHGLHAEPLPVKINHPAFVAQIPKERVGGFIAAPECTWTDGLFAGHVEVIDGAAVAPVGIKAVSTTALLEGILADAVKPAANPKCAGDAFDVFRDAPVAVIGAGFFGSQR